MPALTPAKERFIRHWGEMAARWGINRTVAQIHALLYVSEEPLTAEEIATTLSVARSNVSTSLRELQAWGIVRVERPLGERRDRFHTLRDVWEMFQVILDERKRREVDPTLEVLRECLVSAEESPSEDAYTRKRLRELLDFFETMDSWYEQIRRLPTGALMKFVKLGGKVRKLLQPGG